MAPTPQENAALVRRFLTDAVAGGDVDGVGTFVTDGVVDHDPVFGDASAHEAVTAAGWSALAAATVEIDVEDVVATEDRVAVRGTVTGTDCGSLVDPASSGESFEIAYAWFCRIEDGKIAEIWSLPDGLGLVQQLGAVPERSPSRSPNEPNRSP